MDSIFEIEFKYKADNIKLPDFKKFISSLKLKERPKIYEGKSPDFYYSKKYNSTEFYRYRTGDKPELTKKVRFRKRDTWIRYEVDLPLDSKRLNKELVDNFVKLEGYKFNFSITKSFFVARFSEYNLVYYTVFSPTKKKLGTFIEIELNKNRLDKRVSPRRHMKSLSERAEILNQIGLKDTDRLTTSLFDMYRKF